MSKVVWAPLTRSADESPHTCKLKVYWKTTKDWAPGDIQEYRSSIYGLAEAARVSGRRFTCEDFALKLLCQFAADRGLPVKLTDGVREYRNMDIYNPDYHENYPQTAMGFVSMVMVSFGAPDIQRNGTNTVRVGGPADLLPGDLLALALDAKGRASGNRAHHIQVIVQRTDSRIAIFQGNSDWTIHKPITWINRVLNRNSADPDQHAYAGTTPETGQFTRTSDGRWNYRNDVSGNEAEDYLRYFELFRWNFLEFNN
ncbi:hypothetical protein [Paraburkholderia fynbosensis]|uniref:Uncharacterized protein n=1 Tax=Paraburkholderia fynbosensis TaxID=1200993 RepID=A0A6J5FN18_9BURK|nr:hypothetical protein [Paraburkholderia fynbosensis]CAB3781976.1 hypothetical protein LMG27177_01134 [Paraburkholderia fynbosensis]